jgi:hypothetical protein
MVYFFAEMTVCGADSFAENASYELLGAIFMDKKT